MRDFGWLVPVLIVAAVMASRAFQTWVRAKHGYPIEDEEGRRGRRSYRGQVGEGLEAERKIALLSTENERLTGQISRLEERIAVLERIATDPAERVAREIDSLR
ncbi:hypothetical protein HZY97_02110 [Sphingomonas sp. R-74633]|uniref:hypothetical protein n=1 Tax=Sphingomonas sp. R-74633 TaxID=2751188 RepID=UPI0015D1190C|nr:hypothetical protein [Sphingomonas sp. R-74633]